MGGRKCVHVRIMNMTISQAMQVWLFLLFDHLASTIPIDTLIMQALYTSVQATVGEQSTLETF